MMELRERINFKMTLKSKHVDRYSEELETIIVGKYKIGEKDTLDVDYKFFIEYYENITRRLRAIINILEDPEIVVNVDMEELNRGESLIFEFYKKYLEVSLALKNRKMGNKSVEL